MRDHDEVFRRVMQAKEQYERQEKEKSMAQIRKSPPENEAPVVFKVRKKSSKTLVWAMRAVAAVVLLAVIGGLCAAAFLGSGNQKKPGSTPASGDTPAAAVSLADLPAGTVLTMWSPVNEACDLSASFNRAVAEMRTRYPNIDFRVDTSVEEPFTYKEKLETTAPENLPDIFAVWTGDFLGGLVQAGKVYGLNSAFAGYAGQISSAVSERSTFGGQKYGVPYALHTDILFVNMDVLRAAGYNTIPTTYTELIACCDALLEQGITPFDCAAGSGWCVEQYVNAMVLKNGGAAALADIYPEAAATWTNTDAAEAIDLLADLVSSGYFPANATTVADDALTARNALKNGTCAFFMGGDWDCEAFAACTADIRACEFPVIDSTKSSAGQFVGGANDALAVSSTSANKEAAALYAVELGQLISKYAFLDGKALPTWPINYAADDVNGLFRSVADMVLSANALVPYSYARDMFCHSFDRAHEIAFANLLPGLFTGEIDGTTFLTTMAAVAAE